MGEGMVPRSASRPRTDVFVVDGGLARQTACVGTWLARFVVVFLVVGVVVAVSVVVVVVVVVVVLHFERGALNSRVQGGR